MRGTAGAAGASTLAGRRLGCQRPASRALGRATDTGAKRAGAAGGQAVAWRLELAAHGQRVLPRQLGCWSSWRAVTQAGGSGGFVVHGMETARAARGPSEQLLKAVTPSQARSSPKQALPTIAHVAELPSGCGLTTNNELPWLPAYCSHADIMRRPLLTEIVTVARVRTCCAGAACCCSSCRGSRLDALVAAPASAGGHAR